MEAFAARSAEAAEGTVAVNGKTPRHSFDRTQARPRPMDGPRVGRSDANRHPRPKTACATSPA
jgi:hypothetical protein